MSRASVLARGRAAAEAGMVDACIIRRITGQVTDPDTGEVTNTYTTIYEGKCRLQQISRTQARPEQAGEAYLLMLRRELQLPMSVTGLRTEDEVTMTASAYDPDLPGRVFLIRDLFGKTEATARRIAVEEVTS
ncbi:MAG TPA: DUF6093 family protein [Trebonia sp.]